MYEPETAEVDLSEMFGVVRTGATHAPQLRDLVRGEVTVVATVTGHRMRARKGGAMAMELDEIALLPLAFKAAEAGALISALIEAFERAGAGPALSAFIDQNRTMQREIYNGRHGRS